MSKRRFNESQIKELMNSPNIERCSDKSISYSKEFKVFAVKKYYEDGYSPRMIFNEAGISSELIGVDTANVCLQRWRKVYMTRGEKRLSIETRGKHNKGGRPRTKGLSDADRIKRMTIEIAYLKAENDFLAKLRAAKKR